MRHGEDCTVDVLSRLQPFHRRIEVRSGDVGRQHQGVDAVALEERAPDDRRANMRDRRTKDIEEARQRIDG
ncbi:hypothetical protein D3C76_1811080 [compost metagenome]